MIFKNTRVFNFEGAFYDLAGPASDSSFGLGNIDSLKEDYKMSEKWCKKEPDEKEERFRQRREDRIQWLLKNGILQKNNGGYIEYAFLGPLDICLAQKQILYNKKETFLKHIYVYTNIFASSNQFKIANWSTNYFVIRNIFLKTDYKEFIEWVESLPYAKELIMI